MKDVKLRVIKWNYTGDNDIFYLEDYCSSIKLSENLKQVASELYFTMAYATMSDNLLPLNIETGDSITLFYQDNQIFNGSITDTDLTGKGQEMKVTAYDYTWWICKSNITRNITNINIFDAVCSIYDELRASYDSDYIASELGNNANIILKSHLVKNKAADKVLYAIYSDVTNKTGVGYYMHTKADGCTIVITEVDKYFSGMTIQPPSSNTNSQEIDGNLIDYEITNSMQNMITRVKFYDSTGEVKSNLGTNGEIEIDSTGIKRYGIIQETVEIESTDTTGQLALFKGQQKLDKQGKPSEDLNVTCIGDAKYRAGYGVVIKLPNTSYYNICMYINSSEWTWNKDGTFVSKLVLSRSKYTNEIDWESIEDKQSEEGDLNDTSNNNLANRIIEELKSHLGLAYKYGGQSPSDGGMDCSGYVAYCYNKFSDELSITSNDGKLTPQTFAMMDEGEDVTSDFPDNLQLCDIIFPAAEQGGHVVAYIGNNQIIEEPSSGNVCRIVDMSKDSRFSSAYKVIRVVPKSTSNSALYESTGKYSSKLVEFTESWEGFSSTWYTGDGTYTIGYGTSTAGDVGTSLKAQGTTSCTKSEAESWLEEELDSMSKIIQSAIDKKGVTLNQQAFDCLCDLSYQWGTGSIIDSDRHSIFSSLCNGDADSAKSGISTLGYGRRDNARCDLLDGNYTLNN